MFTAGLVQQTAGVCGRTQPGAGRFSANWAEVEEIRWPRTRCLPSCPRLASTPRLRPRYSGSLEGLRTGSSFWSNTGTTPRSEWTVFLIRFFLFIFNFFCYCEPKLNLPYTLRLKILSSSPALLVATHVYLPLSVVWVAVTVSVLPSGLILQRHKEHGHAVLCCGFNAYRHHITVSWSTLPARLTETPETTCTSYFQDITSLFWVIISFFQDIQ